MKMEGGVYTMFDTGAGGPGGGIGGKMNPGQPTAWLPYVGVKSVKKAMDKAKSIGATPIVEYMPIASAGAMGVFVDPTGATFAVWESFAQPKKPAAKKTAKKPAKKKK
jgi:predicted enzyme related to lactoylglutathione lyase